MSDHDGIPFSVSGGGKPRVPAAEHEIVESDVPADLGKRLEKLINAGSVVLFMKGNALSPLCGFSANSVGILDQLGVDYKTFNILSDESVRQGLKEYSNWPTYPQLYVKGKLVGGNDILMELYESGELQEMVK